MKQWQILFPCAPKITTISDCSHGIKRHKLLGRKAMTNLDSILKSRDFTLPTKIHIVKTMVFPVVMYRCERQTIKMIESRRIDRFKLWWWRKRLRVPWTARRSSQSILKEINPEYSLKVLQWKGKKRNEFFFLHFLRTKNIKRTVSRPELFFFFL